MNICRVSYTRIRCCRIPWLIARSLSHATKLKSPLKHHEILTLLHKATSLLPRALPPEGQAEKSTESLKLWNEILLKTHTDLVSKDTPTARIIGELSLPYS